MNATQFFRACRELVEVRWFPRARMGGSLYLVRFSDRIVGGGFGLEVLPIVAVAEDMFGRAANVHDVSSAAEAIELPTHLVSLIHKASCAKDLSNPIVREVREELLGAVSSPNCLLKRVG